MTRLGADPDDLLRLRAQLDRTATALATVASRTGRQLRAARWQGPDAAAARRDWDRRSAPALAAAAARCRAASSALAVQVDEQRRASRSGPRTAAHPSAAPPAPPLGPPPGRTTRVEGTGALSGAVAVLGGAVVVESEVLPGGRRAVTVHTEVGSGAAAALGEGLGIEVEGHGSGKGAAAGLQLTGTVSESRRWEVDRGDVDVLLAQVVAERLASATPVTAALAAARRALPGESLVDRPVAVERTVGGNLTGSVEVRTGVGGFSTAADSGVRVGHLREGGTDAVVVEYEGVLGAEAFTPLAALAGRTAPGAAVESRVRLVAPLSGPRSGTVHVVAESVLPSRHGSTGSVDRFEVSVSRAATGSTQLPEAAELAAAAAALGGGDVIGAARHLGGPLGERSVAVRVLRGNVTERSAGVWAESGVGLELAGRSTTTTWEVTPRRAS